MKLAQKYSKKDKCYTPNITLVRYLEDKLQIEKNKHQGIEVKDNKIRRRKVFMLDKHIFEAMANLTYFFEFIAKNSEFMNNVFESDIEELLLGVAGSTKKGNLPIFRRFIDAILSTPITTENDFRLELMNIMQRILFYRIHSLALRHNGEEIANNVVQFDMGRALAYASTYASKYIQDKDMHEDVHRPVSF